MVAAVPILTTDDQKWFSERYPRLILLLGEDELVVRGTLDFHREYKGVPINSTYRIRAHISKTKPPVIKESGGRIEKVREKRKSSRADMHMYPDGRLCVMAPQEWRLKIQPKFDIRHLFETYIESYLYSQAYLEAYDEWPWPHYSHDTKGLLEWFVENWQHNDAAHVTAQLIKKLATKNDRDARRLINQASEDPGFSLFKKCLCFSGEPYWKCHPIYAKLAVCLDDQQS